MAGKKTQKKAKPRSENKSNTSGIDITQSSIRRLGRRANVYRIKSDVYDFARQTLLTSLVHVLERAQLITRYHGRSTISANDVYDTLATMNIHLVAGINRNSKSTFKTCSSTRKRKVGKMRRSKTGTETKRDIAYQQKHSDSFAIPRTNFARIAREIVRDKANKDDVNMRFGGNCIDLAQLTIETMLIHLFNAANNIATASGRKTVEKRDVELASQLISSPLL